MRQKIFFAFVILGLTAVVTGAQPPRRAIAITIDDLPVSSARGDIGTLREITKNLLAKIKAANVPAIGFVNETQLYHDEMRDEPEVDLLREWLDAGLELGNHTFSHHSINDGLEAYEVDILKGEPITKELLAKYGKEMRYFRHPYLDTGLTLKIKSDFNRFLKEHGYIIAPVTMDNSDWIFADAYEKAFVSGDAKLMKRIGTAYVPYVRSKMVYWERQSVRLFGREIRQIILLHANFINSVYLGDLVRMLKRRGYRFVSLADAMRDKAYRLPDRYIQPGGISWLHRWALAKGKGYLLPGEPLTPKFVMKAAGVESE